jgi:hypothetical protein
LFDHDVAINFGVIVGKVILVDYCAVIVIYFAKKQKNSRNKNKPKIELWYCSKWNFLWNLASAFKFLKENDVLSKTSGL